MDIILLPIGSAGDVHPYIGLGREFKRRGHHVTVFTNDYFKSLTENAGLEFVASSNADEFTSAADDPRLWHPTKAFEFVARHSFLPLIPTIYKFLEEKYVPGQTLVVGSSLAWGARIAQEKLGISLITLHLQPSILMSSHETPVYGGLMKIAKMPGILKKGYLRLADLATDSIAAPEINRFRLSLGLRPVRRILREWTHSPLKTIGLFPDWFAPPQADWPAQAELTDFPLYDVDDIQTMPAELETFLAAGKPPVVFTAGSAMKQARAMFEVSVEACRRLGCRGVIVNKFPDQIPSELPDGVIAVSYTPFSRLFRSAAAVVHHGGIGTTAQALAAGAPALITPFAHDQFDNAARVQRLGAGEFIFPKKYNVKNVTAALERLMSDKTVHAKAAEVSARLKNSQGISRTCDTILKTKERK